MNYSRPPSPSLPLVLSHLVTMTWRRALTTRHRHRHDNNNNAHSPSPSISLVPMTTTTTTIPTPCPHAPQVTTGDAPRQHDNDNDAPLLSPSVSLVPTTTTTPTPHPHTSSDDWRHAPMTRQLHDDDNDAHTPSSNTSGDNRNDNADIATPTTPLHAFVLALVHPIPVLRGHRSNGTTHTIVRVVLLLLLPSPLPSLPARTPRVYLW